MFCFNIFYRKVFSFCYNLYMKYFLNNSIFINGLVNKYQYSKEFLCEYLNVSRRAVNNYLNGKKLSNKAFINLTILLDEKMIDPFSLIDFDDANHLYHASREGIKGKISVNYNKNHQLDFGGGFYLSESFKTVLSYVDHYPSPIIIRFSKNEITRHKQYIFGESLIDAKNWVLFIGLNRKKIPNKNDELFLKEYYSRLFNNYPILTGKIADSYNFAIMDKFFLDIYDVKQVNFVLKCVDIGNQIVIKDQKIIDSISEFDEIVLDKDLLHYFNAYHIKKIAQIKKNNSELLKKEKRDESFLYSHLLGEMIDEYRKNK